MEREKKYILLWQEHVHLKSLIIGLLIQVVLLVIALIIPFKDNNMKLVSGLGAIIIGLFINSFWIKPKRTIITKEAFNNDN